MSAPTALYRRYRPDSFADVIGQEHVTAPLMAALEKNRVNHAYLFSGPRGCGKTTSARILARCLNCAQGPTSHPCGNCDSCVELARGGAGSLDVIEIDAASHGGVDDARDLRERATFAPIRDRYKIFIIDEAHMVTSAGFNALLKIVEEPPEHIKFIFATTEPDKVIGTIRSRTHHYPFRLVPPEPLMAYLARLCEQENVPVAPGVLSLVIRAGGGSVRDSLSVLDQLMAGAGAAGLDYELAVDLLGYTHASLLDDVVEALAASDAATVFKSVDRVIQTGHDPRRFVEDLLERFRDLIIVQAMPESAHAILRGTPEELIARMQTQAAQLGASELSRAADVTNTAFNEMTGATSPRLHLELLGARLLLPGADASARGMAARLDQMERRLNYGGTPSPASAPPDAPFASAAPPLASAPPAAPGGGLAAVRAELAKAKAEAGAQVASRHRDAEPQAPARGAPAGTAPSHQGQGHQGQGPAAPDAQPSAAAPPSPAAPAAEPTPSPSPSPAPTWEDLETAESTTMPAGQGTPPAPAPADHGTPAGQASGGSAGIEVIRRAWPEILANLSNIRKASWAMVNQNVVPRAFDGETLRVALPTTALIQTFGNSGHADNLRQAIHSTLGITCQLDPVTGDAPNPGSSAEPNPKGLADPRPASGAGRPRPANAPAAGPPAVQTPAPAPVAVPAPARGNGPAAPSITPPLRTSPEAQDLPAAPQPRPGLRVSAWDGPIPEEPTWADEPPPEDWSEQAAPSRPGAPAALPSDGSPRAAGAPPSAPAPHPAHDTGGPAPDAGQATAPQRPKVSSISAWTSGWDLPTDTPKAPPAPAEMAAPRRSQRLASQAQQSAPPDSLQESPQDWGVSLGAASRNSVADPGWGAPANAPDWAQPAPPPSSNPAPAGSATGAPNPGTSRAGTSQAGTSRAAPAETSGGTPAAPERAGAADASSGVAASNVAAQAPHRTAGEKLSMYQRLSNSPEAQAGRARVPDRAADVPCVEDVPSPDDLTIEESGVVGQAAVERILGGQLVEEKPLTGGSY